MNLSETVRLHMEAIDYETEVTKHEVASACNMDMMQASNRLSKLFRSGKVGRRGAHGHYKYFKVRQPKPPIRNFIIPAHSASPKQATLNIENRVSDIEFLENLLTSMAEAEPIIRKMIKVQQAFQED